MTKRILPIILMLLAVMAEGHTQVKTYISDRSLSARQEQTIEFLCDSICNGRASGTKGSFEAISYISGIFRENGLVPFFKEGYIQRFMVDNKRSGANIVGFIPGTNPGKYEKPYIIVGAHFDHLGELSGKMYPGADDNASGIAALQFIIEKIAATQSHGRHIIFVAYDAKEYSMAGSATFAAKAFGQYLDPQDVAFTVNIDQIGSILEPFDDKREYMIVLGKEDLLSHEQNILRIMGKYFVPDLSIAYDYYGSEQFTEFFKKTSDQRTFKAYGIPSLLFTSGITGHTYKSTDTPETIDPKALMMRSKVIYLFVERLAR